MSDQPTPDRWLQWVILGEQPDYKPVEPVGTLTVRSNGTSHIDNLFGVLPGKYLLIPKEADDE